MFKLGKNNTSGNEIANTEGAYEGNIVKDEEVRSLGENKERGKENSEESSNMISGGLVLRSKRLNGQQRSKKVGQSERVSFSYSRTYSQETSQVGRSCVLPKLVTGLAEGFSPCPLLSKGFGLTKGKNQRAEGSFTVSVLKSALIKIGYAVSAIFKITVHTNDSRVIYELKKNFESLNTFVEIGKIVIDNDTCTYRISSLK